MLHKEADKKIIQYNTDQYQQEITEKLNTSLQYGTRENHMTHQHKAGGKTNKKGYDKSSNMGLEGDSKSQVQDLFMQNEIVCQEKNENVKGCIESTANSIAKSL